MQTLQPSSCLQTASCSCERTNCTPNVSIPRSYNSKAAPQRSRKASASMRSASPQFPDPPQAPSVFGWGRRIGSDNLRGSIEPARRLELPQRQMLKVLLILHCRRTDDWWHSADQLKAMSTFGCSTWGDECSADLRQTRARRSIRSGLQTVLE